MPRGVLLRYLIVLAGSEPLVWRRIAIPATYSFWDFHVAIQDAMGWRDVHLHQFEVVDPKTGKTFRVGIPDPDYPEDRPTSAGWNEFPLEFIRSDQHPMRYTYDFGDGWRHALIFEGYEQRDARRRMKPECIDGAGACPPEDCGGVHGYRDLLAALADPTHPGHGQWLEWAGGPIDPAAFSPSDVRFDDPEKRWRLAFDGDGR
jgi:hypothetical protein